MKKEQLLMEMLGVKKAQPSPVKHVVKEYEESKIAQLYSMDDDENEKEEEDVEEENQSDRMESEGFNDRDSESQDDGETNLDPPSGLLKEEEEFVMAAPESISQTDFSKRYTPKVTEYEHHRTSQLEDMLASTPVEKFIPIEEIEFR